MAERYHILRFWNSTLVLPFLITSHTAQKVGIPFTRVVSPQNARGFELSGRSDSKTWPKLRPPFYFKGPQLLSPKSFIIIQIYEFTAFAMLIALQAGPPILTITLAFAPGSEKTSNSSYRPKPRNWPQVAPLKPSEPAGGIVSKWNSTTGRPHSLPSNFTICRGFTLALSTVRPQCRCGPVTRPVAPTFPRTAPASKVSPTFTPISDRCP
jgi:hypothetical protein